MTAGEVWRRILDEEGGPGACEERREQVVAVACTALTALRTLGAEGLAPGEVAARCHDLHRAAEVGLAARRQVHADRVYLQVLRASLTLSQEALTAWQRCERARETWRL